MPDFDLDRALLATCGPPCMMVFAEPPQQVRARAMASNRRLTAILAGDMTGYSRLMEADEASVSRLRAGRGAFP